MTEKILNISVNGALGNMGRYVMDTVAESADMKLCFGVDKKSKKILSKSVPKSLKNL